MSILIELIRFFKLQVVIINKIRTQRVKLAKPARTSSTFLWTIIIKTDEEAMVDPQLILLSVLCNMRTVRDGGFWKSANGSEGTS